MRARKDTIALARGLRRSLSLPEAMLWTALRGKKAGGLKFRRQHPIGPYVLDFFCTEVRLAVEVDGGIHYEPDQRRSDDRRDRWLESQGVRVLRVPARWVLENPDGTAAMIAKAARNPGIIGRDT